MRRLDLSGGIRSSLLGFTMGLSGVALDTLSFGGCRRMILVPPLLSVGLSV